MDLTFFSKVCRSVEFLSAGNFFAKPAKAPWRWLTLVGVVCVSMLSATIAIAQQPLTNPNLLLLRNAEVRAMARQADGKLLLATNGVADARYLGTPPSFDAAGNPVGIGGTFINGLMRVNADGSRDTAFTVDLPNDNNTNTFSGNIWDVKIFGNFAYVLGDFTTIGGVARAGLARINLTTNTVDAGWNPNPQRRIANQTAVGSMALDGAGNLYTFGSLYDIGGKLNVRMAKIPASSANGQADANFDGRFVTVNLVDDISADVGIYAAPTSNGALYAVGRKVNAGSTQKMRIYKINAITGVQDTSWNANLQAIDMLINGVAVNAGGDIFVGGQVAGNITIGQNLTSPYTLLKLSGVTGQVPSAWVGGLSGPNTLANGLTYPVRVHYGVALDAAGNVYSIAGRLLGDTSTAFYSKYDGNTGLRATGFAESEITGANGFEAWVFAAPDGIYGSGPGYYGGARTGSIIKLDANNGTLVSGFNVNVKNSGLISASTKLDDGRVVMSGAFNEVNGVAVNNLIRFNTDGTFDPTFTNGPNSLVMNVKHIAGKLYASGPFSFSGTAPRKFIARYDALTGALDTTWSPALDGNARAITGDATTIYMVGGFYTINGSVTGCISKLSATTGLPDLGWQPAMTGITLGSICQRAIAKVGNFVYVGLPNNSSFLGVPRLVVNGQNRTLARIDATTGVVDNSFDPNPNGTVQSMESDGTNIFLSGGFNTIGGVSTRLAKMSGATGAIDATFVQPLTGLPNNATWIRPTADAIFLTGTEFVNTESRPYVWKFAPNGSRDTAWSPTFEPTDQSETFNAAAEPFGVNRIMIGAGFTAAGTANLLRIAVAAFSTVPSAALTFNQVGRGTYVIGNSSLTGTVSCNNCSTGSKTYDFDTGTVLTLNVRPTPGWVFSGWSGASGSASCTGTGTCSVTLNAASAVTATFTKVADLIEE